MRRVPLLVVVLLAALAPFARAPLASASAGSAVERAFPGWPSQIEGRTVRQLPLTPQDAYFAKGFPGRIARFTDGRRHIVVRWVAAPTRQLHPAAHCFRASGHAIAPAPMRRDPAGRLAACFNASRAGETFRVCERVDGDDGGSWSDVSSWYWAALFAPQERSWWSLTFVEAADADQWQARP